MSELHQLTDGAVRRCRVKGGWAVWNLKNLFQSHALEIQRVLQKSGHGSDVAEDLTQDAFVRLLASETSQQAENPRAYLHKVAKNLAVDRHRREQVVPMDAIGEDSYQTLADEAPGPEKIIADRQQLALLQRRLAALPQPMRRAFELYRLNDMTIAEVAVELDLSVSRTWTLIRQAYLQLRAGLDD